MAELVATTGRPMVHDLRAVLDAINYVTRCGIERRALPVDFPPHEAASCRRPGASIPRRSRRPRTSGLRPAVLTGARR
ncbi:transposase [Streptosporangium soli]